MLSTPGPWAPSEAACFSCSCKGAESALIRLGRCLRSRGLLDPLVPPAGLSGGPHPGPGHCWVHLGTGETVDHSVPRAPAPGWRPVGGCGREVSGVPPLTALPWRAQPSPASQCGTDFQEPSLPPAASPTWLRAGRSPGFWRRSGSAGSRGASVVDYANAPL